MAEEKLPDIIPLGGSTPIADEFETVFDPASGSTVVRRRSSRAGGAAGEGQQVVGKLSAIGQGIVRDWQGETKGDLAGDFAKAFILKQNLERLAPLTPDEENELASLKTAPRMAAYPSGPYMPPYSQNNLGFQRQVELERRKNAPSLVAQIDLDLQRMATELEEVESILARNQGVTAGAKKFNEADGAWAKTKVFLRNPLDVSATKAAESAYTGAKISAAAAGTTLATVASGGTLPLATGLGILTAGTMTANEGYDQTLLEELIKMDPKIAKDPKGFLEAYKKNPVDYRKAYDEAKSQALKIGAAQGAAEAATAGLLKFIPPAKTAVGRFFADQVGEQAEELSSLFAEKGVQGQLPTGGELADTVFSTIAGTTAQNAVTGAGGYAIDKSGIKGAISEAMRPRLQVNLDTLIPLGQPGQGTQPTAAPGIAPLQITPGSLVPADQGVTQTTDPVSAAGQTEMPDVIPLTPPAPAAAASASDQDLPTLPQGRAGQPQQAAQAQIPGVQQPQAPTSVSSAFDPAQATTQATSAPQANTQAPQAQGRLGTSASDYRTPRAGRSIVMVDPSKVLSAVGETDPSRDIRQPGNQLSNDRGPRLAQASAFLGDQNNRGRLEASQVGLRDDGRLGIADGRHRLLAAQQAGLSQVGVEVSDEDAPNMARFAPDQAQQAGSPAQPAAQPAAQNAPMPGAQPVTVGRMPLQPGTQAAQAQGQAAPQGQRPISLTPPKPPTQAPAAPQRNLTPQEQAAWSNLERKAAELDRRREARRQQQARNTNPDTRNRGPEQIAMRLINELRTGGNLTLQEANGALRIVEKLMENGYLDNLAVSVSNAQRGGGVRGEYNPVKELVQLFVRNTNRPGVFKRTFAHEVSHHLERMVPAKDLEAARQQFLRERAKWLSDKKGLRALLGEGNWLDRSFTNQQIRDFLSKNNMDPALISKFFIRDTRTGRWRIKLTDETYRYTNFSEYFAEKVAQIAGDRDDNRANNQANPGVWAKVKDMLAQIKKAMIEVFGRDEVEAIWDKFQQGEYSSEFQRDQLQGYDNTGGQNPVQDNLTTSDYRAPRVGPADAGRQGRVEAIDRLEPNRPIQPPQSARLTGEEQSQVDDMKFAAEQMLRDSGSPAVQSARDDEASAEKLTGGFESGAALYITARQFEGLTREQAWEEILKKFSGNNKVTNQAMKAKEAIFQIVDSLDGLPVSVAFEEGSKLASTRYPDAASATENPNQYNLQSDISTVYSNPLKMRDFATSLKKVSGFRYDPSMTDRQIIDSFINHVKANLLHMHDSVPEQIRQRSKLWYVGANLIAKRLSNEHGVSHEAAAGVLAVLSPQMDWYKNVSLAERAMDIIINKSGHAVDDRMIQAMKSRNAIAKIALELKETKAGIPKEERTKYPDDKDNGRRANKIRQMARDAVDELGLAGQKIGEIKVSRLQAIAVRAYDEAYNPRSYEVITPEGNKGGPFTSIDGEDSEVGWGGFGTIEKVFSIINDQSLENISRQLGGEHKVRNFYNNIIDPDARNGQVTIDTHAVAAALMEPLSGEDPEVKANLGGAGGSAMTGLSGLYPIYAHAYAEAARARGILPREMQSITWEAVRGLFTAKYKTNEENITKIKSIWDSYKSGEIDIAEARARIEREAGGYNDPTWHRPNGQSPEGARPGSNQGQLGGPELGQDGERADARRKGGDTGGSPVRSARDDGENTPIPGGYREAFFQAKKGAGAPEPKQIKWWTDIGHDIDADPDKQFLWAINRQGELKVVSIADLERQMLDAGYNGTTEQNEYGENVGPSHLDWSDVSQDSWLLAGPGHGRIDATGDTVRVSLTQRGRSSPEIKADMQANVKQQLAEAMGLEPGSMRGYDFTDAGPFTGPEVFSARDEEGPQKLGIERAFPASDEDAGFVPFSNRAKALLGKGYGLSVRNKDKVRPVISVTSPSGEALAEVQIAIKTGKDGKPSVSKKSPEFPNRGLTAELTAFGSALIDPKWSRMLRKNEAELTLESLMAEKKRLLDLAKKGVADLKDVIVASPEEVARNPYRHGGPLYKTQSEFEFYKEANLRQLEKAQDAWAQTPKTQAQFDQWQKSQLAKRDAVINNPTQHDAALVAMFSETLERLRQMGVTRVNFDTLDHGMRTVDLMAATAKINNMLMPGAEGDTEGVSGYSPIPGIDNVNVNGNLFTALQVAAKKASPDAWKDGWTGTSDASYALDPNTAYSARDEEPAPRQLKADPVVRGNPEEDLSLPMDNRFATYPKGEEFTREGADGSVEAYNILGRNKASPERMRQIQEFVKDSKVKHALYRGQNGAYEKPSTFLARDGLIHLTDDPDYAAQYAESPGKRVPEEGTKSAIAQVYLNAENILDLSKFGHTISDKNASTKIPEMANDIYRQITAINGGEIPGLQKEILEALKTEFLDHDDGFDTEGLTGGNVWRALIPLEKVVGVFDLGIHAIKYSDSDVRTARGEKRGGKVSYAINDPARIKAAFGDNDVNPDTGNIFQSARDEDGDYRGSHRAPDGTNGEGSLDAMDRTYPEDIYGPNGARYYGARRSDDAKIHKLIQSVRGNPDAMVTVYRAVPKGVAAEITPGNWVSPSREYAAEHGERFPNGFDILERRVRAGELFTEGNSLQEFGWNPTGESIQSARDEDGENTVIPGGNREAFFVKKDGVPQPKRIKYYTDIGHPTKGQDKNKFFLWAIDDRGKLRVRSVAEVEQMVQQTGKDPEAFMSYDDEVMHGDWFHNSAETGNDGSLRGTEAMGRIDASGDVIRISYGTRGTDGNPAEINIEARDNVKRMIADYLRQKPENIRGYDFTETMETGADPEVFSARDEEPAVGRGTRAAAIGAAAALTPTTLEAATGAAKTGATIAGVAMGDLIGLATGVALTSTDRPLRGLNPIAANMHLLANDTKSPTLKRIANMFGLLGGNTSAGAQETYHDSRDSSRRIFRNKLAAAFEPLAKLSQDQIRALDVTIARALAGEIPMPAGAVGQVVQNLRALSDELYNHLRAAGVDVNYAQDYAIPHSFNAEAVAKDEQAFIDAAEQAYIRNNPDRIRTLNGYMAQIAAQAKASGWTAEMRDQSAALQAEIDKLRNADPRKQAEDLAAAILSGEDGGDQSQGLLLGSNPQNQNKADFLKGRVFESAARAMLREYFQNDPRHAWNNYIARATTISEFSRRFGKDGGKWNDMVQKMRAEKVSNEDITRIKELVLDAMGALTPAARGGHALANALLGLSNMSKLKSTFLTNFLEAQAQAIPGGLLDTVTAPVLMMKEFAAILAELSPRQRALLKQYLRVDLNTETGNMELARVVGLMDASGIHQIMENSAYNLERASDFREDSRTDRNARRISNATGNLARAYGIEASENAKRAMGARYAAGRLDQHVSELIRDNILARALAKVGYTGDKLTTRNEARMRLRRAGVSDADMQAFSKWWEAARASGRFNEMLADSSDPMAALARRAIRMESSRAMVNSNRAMKPGGERNKAISQDNFWGKAVMSFLNYPAAFREQVAKPMARDIRTGFRGSETEAGETTFFSPAERARMIAKVSAIPAMAVSAAAYLALRTLALGDDEDKEELDKKGPMSLLIDGLSYTGFLGGKTEAIQRARRGQLPPIVDEAVRLGKNLDREATQSNGKERAVTKSLNRSVAVPAAQAVASSTLPMPMATVVDQLLASRAFTEMVVNTVAGPAQAKGSGYTGAKRETGRESGRSSSRPDGR